MKRKLILLVILLCILSIIFTIFRKSSKKLNFEAQNVTRVELTTLNPYQTNLVSSDDTEELISIINNITLSKPYINNAKGYSHIITIYEGRKSKQITLIGNKVDLGTWTYYASPKMLQTLKDYITSILPNSENIQTKIQ